MKKDILKNLINSTFAGFLIGLAAFTYAYLKVVPLVGSILFSFGLLTIIDLKFNLFTGKVGFTTRKDILTVLLCFLFNFVGVLIVGLIALLMKNDISEIVITNSINIATSKAEKNILDILLRSILCGSIIHLVVLSKKPINIICGVVIFIICGFEHSIANMFYFITAKNVEIFWFIPICAIGNSIGALFIGIPLRFISKQKNNENNKIE